MDINKNSKVMAILEAYPDLEDTLLSLSPQFAKLKNPALMRTIARVATLEQASKVAGIKVEDMVAVLRKKVGLPITNADSGESDKNIADAERKADGKTGSPDWFDKAKIAIKFDARPILAEGKSPMQTIIRQSKELKSGEIMELIVPFEPSPIMEQLKTQGLKAWYGDGKCFFYKE